MVMPAATWVETDAAASGMVSPGAATSSFPAVFYQRETWPSLPAVGRASAYNDRREKSGSL